MADRGDDFEQRWAEIVADLTATHGAIDDSPPRVARDVPGADQSGGASGADQTGGEPGATAPGGGATDAFVDNWSDEGHFTPPPPPEIPAGTPLKRLAWVGTLGGPATLAFIALTGWDAPRAVGIGAGLAFLAGFATLIWQLPESRDDGWDDGARL